MNTALLGTLRLSIIDNLRAEIREREEVIADLTRDEEATPGFSMRYFNEVQEGTPPPTWTPIGKEYVKKAMAEAKKAPAPLGAKRKGSGDNVAKNYALKDTSPENFLAYVKQHPGERAEDIARGLSVK